MAQIRIDLPAKLVDGMDIKFQAPCDCSAVTGLIVYYPVEDGSIATKEFTFRDAHNNDLTGLSNLFAKDAYVKVIVDAKKGYAYLQNADANSFLNSAILGPYIHDGENLTGCGENGKFKATVSGTISTINVNGVRCSVKCGEESSMDLVAGCWYTFILDGDTVNFNAGGAGGGGLNFSVVGGTSAPASPKENTIWVNTDTEITGWIFSATEPEAPAEGMVWISTGVSSSAEFNALKKNGIMVYPMSAKQYVSGAWVNKTAKSYLNGAWADWSKFIVPSNDFTWSSYDTSRSTVTKNADGSISITGITADYYGLGFTDEQFDLTGYNKMEVVYTSTSAQSGSKIGVSTTKSANHNDAFIAFINVSKSSAKVTATLDISSINRFVYFGASQMNANITVYEIRLSA